MTLELWTAFVIGFLGSIHCIGMCGPIALALPGGMPSKTHLVASRLLYNGGRILTYAGLGAICGLLGKTIAMAGFQQVLSIVAGVAILLAVFIPSRLSRRILPGKLTARLVDRIKSVWVRLFSNRSMRSLFLIGLLNGFLPCGFLYLGLAASATTGSVAGGAGYMAMFGLGTTPALLITSLFGGMLSLRIRRFFLKLLPVGAVVLGLLLVLRGMSLGIPYLSPDMDKQKVHNTSCH